MSEMLSVASGFQYSVNIGYDLNDDDKLRNFIPTKSALQLLEDILLSTNPASTERSRVLIGAYGKGKSHIVLMILSMLMKRDLALFEKVMPRVQENPALKQAVLNYYESSNKIMPIVITGSNTSLSQAFLIALQRTLSDNDMLDVMPETNYKAAISVIHRWEREFPETFARFKNYIDVPIPKFISLLENYDTVSYETFERIYPSLTAGSVFNPFLGFDVVELYECAAKGIRSRGYSGIFVVYDEFSKYLEANITEASVSDTKMLQDLAERCNRSGALQMHLMLISHKEISNYIDKLPKHKVDGWRGVSERFKHIHLNNNFTQTYDIISSVIQKHDPLWDNFTISHAAEFRGLEQRYQYHPMFAESEEGLRSALFGCYPLHPVSTFILPRLSERVAQNERTLFTFLSSSGDVTLPSVLDKYTDRDFLSVTPDLIYDYFEPLFKKEVYANDIHSYYILAANILKKLEEVSLGSKIIKTLSLIYILGQFEKLKPTKEELIGIYSVSYSVDEIEAAIRNLVEEEYVIYLKRSNAYLRLKQSSGVDIRQKINDTIEVQKGRVSVKDTLNNANFDNCLYPARYNDEREITRYFSFEFIDESEISADTNWEIKSASIHADGVIYGIITHCEDSIGSLCRTLLITSSTSNRCIFALPKHHRDIERIVREYYAVSTLKKGTESDPVLFDEYEVVFEDLSEVIYSYTSGYTHPEEYGTYYIYDGKLRTIHRKAALTDLMSSICDRVFGLTPVINNEVINRDEITTVAAKSRNKLISALLRNDLEHNLGLSGTGQEVSIMRSALIRTGIWQENNGVCSINLSPEDKHIKGMLDTIAGFIDSAKRQDEIPFAALYDKLTSPKHHIGLRRGLIPLYLSVVLHEYKQQVIIQDRYGQLQLSLDTLLQIDANPENYSIVYLDWNQDKEEYIEALSDLFKENIVDAERRSGLYDHVAHAIKRWFLSLPKYAKETKTAPDGSKIDRRYLSMMKLFRQNGSSYELLFVQIPKAFGYEENFLAEVEKDIAAAKEYYDSLLGNLKSYLIGITKETFAISTETGALARMSLSSVISDWCERLDDKVFEQLFPDGTDKCLKLFKNVMNDEEAFVSNLGRLATDLRIEDWDNGQISTYLQALLKYKKTAEEYVSNARTEEIAAASTYQVTFIDDAGVTQTRRFDKVDISRRGKLLYNQITSSLDSMGHAISEQEKRQVLMEILEKLC